MCQMLVRDIVHKHTTFVFANTAFRKLTTSMVSVTTPRKVIQEVASTSKFLLYTKNEKRGKNKYLKKTLQKVTTNTPRPEFQIE
jgi:hypothetical protein